ncbi:MAG: dienelactone hydrolase family protein [Rhodothermales bacterium]|nr:dienelactone hydrolase family protein [Rhodothermales bacterium]
MADDSAATSIVTQQIDYTSGDVTMKGYLAYDSSIDGQRPGVLVVHEWWGHNEYSRRRAEMLAELGYTALAIDMYGDGKTAEHPDDAMAFAQQIGSDMDEARARFEAARALLARHETIDAERIGAIGYCFGGSVVLEMARRGVDLDGVASFHGGLGTAAPAARGAISGSILVLHGGLDPMAPAEQVQAFRNEMDAAGADYEVVVYDDATHGFTNPAADSAAARFELPLAYNPDADRQSWDKMKAFFADAFSD